MSNHLHPEAPVFQRWTTGGEYHLQVAQLLFTEQRPPLVAAQVVCLPSFEPEWAIRLCGSEKIGYTAVLTRAESQIWSGNDKEIKVYAHGAVLTSEMAQQIVAAWNSVLSETRPPEHLMCGLDGVSYHFLSRLPSSVVLSGQTWSPDSETTPGHLVTLAHLLHDWLLADDDDLAGWEAKVAAGTRMVSRSAVATAAGGQGKAAVFNDVEEDAEPA